MFYFAAISQNKWWHAFQVAAIQGILSHFMLSLWTHFWAAERHLPYGITQCYLPPEWWTSPTSTTAKHADSQFTYPGRIEGWVIIIIIIIIIIAVTWHQISKKNHPVFCVPILDSVLRISLEVLKSINLARPFLKSASLVYQSDALMQMMMMMMMNRWS